MATQSPKWEAIKALFEAALELDPSSRVAFLESRADDPHVRSEVERLLGEYEEDRHFLSGPMVPAIAPQRGPGARFSTGEVLAHRFRVVRFLAAGGMGEVYEAEDLELRERVAVKTITPALLGRPTAVSQFKREVHLARKVTHPNVCRIFDIFRHKSAFHGSEEDIVFVSMELLQGPTLAETLKQVGRFATDQALPIVRQMATALGAAHEAGIVHRDFKPGNVVLVGERVDAAVRAVVTDFGLAFRAVSADSLLQGRSDQSTNAGREAFGTPAYMAPEQVEGGNVTIATDIYALGLVMYEMVTGRRPFESDTPLAAAVKRLKQCVPSPRTFQPELDPLWEKVILRCLERDPAHRFAKANDVTEALASSNSSVLDRSVTSKRRWRFALVSIGLLLVVSGLLSYEFRARAKLVAPVHPVTPVRRSVAVLGFQNLSARPDAEWLSTAISETLTTELGLGEKLRTIPGESVAQMKRNLALAEADSYGPETLSRIHQTLGADYIVLGSYLAAPDGQLRLDLRLENADNGEMVSSLSARGTQSQIDELVSRTGADVRAKLGLGDTSEHDAGEVRDTLPHSADAARLYAEGLTKLRQLDAVSARNLLQRTVSIEPGFALAHSALSQAWMALGYDEKAREQGREAFDFSTKLSPNERLWIEGRYRESGYEWDRAIEIYTALVTAAPDDPEYRLRLAQAQISAGRGRDAFQTIASLRQLPEPVRNDPRIDLAEANAADSLGDFQRAQAAAAAGAKKADYLGLRLLAARIRNRECWDLQNLGDFAQAGAVCQSAKEAFEAAGDRNGVADVENCLANKLAEQGDVRGAQAMYRQALLQYRTTGNRYQEAWALNNIGTLTRELGDYDRAIQQHLDALKIFRETGRKGGIGTSYTNLAINYEMKGDLPASRRSMDRALSIQRELGDKRRISLIQSNRSILLYTLGELEEAMSAANEALEIARVIGNKSLEADAVSHVGAVHWAQNDLGRARKEIEGWLKLDTDLGRKIGAVIAQLDLARLSLDEGQPETAETLARGAVEQSQTLKDTDHEVSARTALAASILPQGKFEEASREIGQALKLSKNNKERDIDLAITAAKIQAAGGSSGNARKALEFYLAEAQKQGKVADEFALRLALGEIELQSGAIAQGRSRLVALRKDTEAKGFLLIAAKANQK